jgi:hypothetical protein
MELASVPTRISKSSQRIRAIPAVVNEPELEPLVPTESDINRTAYELWLEDMLSHLTR